MFRSRNQVRRRSFIGAGLLTSLVFASTSCNERASVIWIPYVKSISYTKSGTKIDLELSSRVRNKIVVMPEEELEVREILCGLFAPSLGATAEDVRSVSIDSVRRSVPGMLVRFHVTGHRPPAVRDGVGCCVDRRRALVTEWVAVSAEGRQISIPEHAWKSQPGSDAILIGVEAQDRDLAGLQNRGEYWIDLLSSDSATARLQWNIRHNIFSNLMGAANRPCPE